MNYKKAYKMCKKYRHKSCSRCPYSVEDSMSEKAFCSAVEYREKLPSFYQTFEDFKRAIIKSKLKNL